MDSFTGN